MSGYLAGISMVQQFDLNHEIMSGARLFVYAAGTTTPVTAYKDGALTPGQEHARPILADAAGRIPMIYLEDGNYRIRLSSSDGAYVAFDVASFPVISPAAEGDNEPPSAISPQLIPATGYTEWQPISGERDGWVRHNGRTIGNAASLATERANADTEALFEYLWNAHIDAICPVFPGGRGANAAADYAANKNIRLLDTRFTIPIGLDDMGNSAAGRATGVPLVTVGGSATTAGSILGAALHALTTVQLPPHTHDNTLNDPGHLHTVHFTTFDRLDLVPTGTSFVQAITNTGGFEGSDTASTSSNTTGISVTNASAGGGTAHNNTPLVMTGTWYVKL